MPASPSLLSVCTTRFARYSAALFTTRLLAGIALVMILCTSIGLSRTHAQTTELLNDLPITAVTVYPRSAIVTRSHNVSIPAGTSTLIISNLPVGLDPARLQLAIGDSAITFGNLQIQENFQTRTINEQEQTLRNQLQTLNDSRQVILDRIEIAQSELRLLGGLTDSGDSGVRATLDGDELATLITVFSENSAQARERIRNATIELRSLDLDIEQQQFALNQIATGQTVYSRLLVRLQSNSAVTSSVSLSYPQAEASWSWLYEARLDTTRRTMTLLRQAAVTQGTGENWSDVALTLSTANPLTNATTPALDPVFVDIAQPRAMMSRAGEMQEVVVTGSAVRDENSLSFKDATVVDTRYQLDYLVPGSVSLPADRQPQVLPVDNRSIAVDLVTRAVPSLDTQAYLEARFDFTEASPMQPARIQLYRDSAFIGATSSPAFLPGQSVRVAFGVDQRVQVQRFDEQQASGYAGLFNRSGIQEDRIRYEITSRHPATIKFELLDRVPVPRHSDIRVEIPRQATAATESDFEGEAGILLWRMDLAPQQTATVRHYVDIRHPADMQIERRP